MKKLWIAVILILLAGIGVYFAAGVRLPETGAPPKTETHPGSPAAKAPRPSGNKALPADRLPLLPVKATRSPELFRERYSLVLRKYHEAGEKGGGGFMGKFAYEMHFCIREARLLALSYPDLAESECVAIAKNPKADPLDLSFAMWSLQFLAMKGRKPAENALFGLATTKNRDLADDAIYHLSASDDGAAFRTTYQEGCRLGASAAFTALSYQADGPTLAFAEELLRNYGEARGDLHRLKLEATTLLERQKLLTSGAWQDRAAKLLEEDQGSPEVTWALRCGRINNLPGMTDVLRRRLDRAEQEASLTFSRYPKGVQKDTPSIEVQFIRHPNPIGLRDKAYDEILVTYVELGGQVNELERQRLRTFGYAGDPEERLSELLAEK